MVTTSCVSTKVDGTDYTIEYDMTQNGEEDDSENPAEYGIRCRLYEREVTVDSKEVKGVTSERWLATKIFQLLEKNQVFPIHLKDIIEDLLVLEYEEKTYRYL